MCKPCEDSHLEFFPTSTTPRKRFVGDLLRRVELPTEPGSAAGTSGVLRFREFSFQRTMREGVQCSLDQTEMRFLHHFPATPLEGCDGGGGSGEKLSL